MELTNEMIWRVVLGAPAGAGPTLEVVRTAGRLGSGRVPGTPVNIASEVRL